MSKAKKDSPHAHTRGSIDNPPTGAPPAVPPQQTPLPPLEPGTVYVSNPVQYQVCRERENAQRYTVDSARQMAGIFDEFTAICHPKPLGKVPAGFEDTFTALKKTLPNSAGMLELFEGACYRAKLRPSKCIPSLKVLLVGEPGIGKTHALEELTAALDLYTYRLSMNGQVGAFELRGLGRHWRNPYPGAIAKCFRESPIANPVILLDEIDKGRVDGNAYGSSLDTLLDLLEASSARTFRDECLDIAINASHATFVATANDLERLPEPLLSRFSVIEISTPTRAQMATVIASIFRTIISEEEGIYDPEMSPEVMSLLLACTPRKAKHHLEHAVNAAAARVIRAGKRRRRPIRVEPGDLPAFSRIRRRSIGFVPQSPD